MTLVEIVKKLKCCREKEQRLIAEVLELTDEQLRPYLQGGSTKELRKGFKQLRASHVLALTFLDRFMLEYAKSEQDKETN